jgi:tRNA A58 N-methylase Trm61
MLSTFIGWIYDRTLRPFLPHKIASYGGVPVKQPRLLDNFDRRPFKPIIQQHIRRHVIEDDRVVDIGSGHGVFAAIAARQGAFVIGYEAADKMVERAKQTAELSYVDDNVEIRHCLVAEAHNIYGKSSDTNRIQPADLPECDVLIMDCEGAEVEVLREIDIRPRVIIVESHPSFEASSHKIRKLIGDIGYDVVAEQSLTRHPDEKRVLVGEQT